MNARRQDIESLRQIPHSVEAESAVLGGLMLDNAAWELVSDALNDDDFYRPDHRLLFRAMGELCRQDKPFDAVTLSEWLKARGQLEQAGGLAYLATLVRDTPTADNVKAYAGIVRERSVLRHLLRMTGEVSEAAYNPGGRTAADLIEMAESQVFTLAERGSRIGSGARKAESYIKGVVDRLDTLVNADSHVTGVATGLAKFDELTAGLQPGDLVIVAGRPSMGKTAWACGVAEYAAIHHNVPSAVFSMEMSGEQLTTRMLSSIGRVDQQKLRTGKLDDTDWKRISAAISTMSKAPVYIDDTGSLTPTELRARARRAKREYGLGLLVVDYLQLMHVAGTGENRATEISEICRNLKALARELNLPVIALSQLNRKLEDRPNKRPVMSDLRESGSIEQDADLIVFIYRDEVYNDDTKDKGVAEIIIGKQRNGPTGTVRSSFLGQFTRFENFAEEQG